MLAGKVQLITFKWFKVFNIHVMTNAASFPPQQLKQLSSAEMSLLINSENPREEVSCFMCVICHFLSCSCPNLYSIVGKYMNAMSFQEDDENIWAVSRGLQFPCVLWGSGKVWRQKRLMRGTEFWKTRKMSWTVRGQHCRDHLIYKGLGVLYKCLIAVWAPVVNLADSGLEMEGPMIPLSKHWAITLSHFKFSARGLTLLQEVSWVLHTAHLPNRAAARVNDTLLSLDSSHHLSVNTDWFPPWLHIVYLCMCAAYVLLTQLWSLHEALKIISSLPNFVKMKKPYWSLTCSLPASKYSKSVRSASARWHR